MFHPKGSNVILTPVEVADRTTGGLYIPERAKHLMNQGQVLEIGPDVPEGILKVGEVVIFAMHVEYRIEVDGAWYICISVNDILAGDEGEFQSRPPAHPELPLQEEKPERKRRAPLGLRAAGL